MRAFFLSSLLVACPAVGAVVEAQTAAPTARRSVAAVRLSEGETITLDGRLDEGVWQRAAPARDFVQIDPINGTPATESTEVRIAFGRDAIYLGVTCFDSEPERWLGYQRRRDEFLSSDDRFMWTIDTFLDAQSGYFFEMNPSGLMGDSLMGGGIDNRQWDGIWDAQVRRDDKGWHIEIELPFRSFNFDPESDTWGINFQRTVRRKNEDSIWMGWARNQGLRRMTNAGLLTGITDVSQGHGLDVKPYGLVSAQKAPGRGDRQTSSNATGGLDVFYSPTPGLRTVATFNTDFAQTEVDQRQVNLTRFSLFFPEKRDFFLDGAPYFSFSSPLSGDLIVNPFFSRRVGLAADSTPQTIDAGGKVTGQIGRQDVGLMYVKTGEDGTSPPESFSVARVRRRMLAQSFVGGIYTRRDPHAGAGFGRYTSGLDVRLATSTFRGNQNLEASGYYLRANNARDQADDSFGVSFASPNDPWTFNGFAREIGAGFDPAMGFVTRRGYRRYQQGAEFGPRPRRHRYVRRYAFAAAGDLQTDLDNELLNRSLELRFTDVQFHSGDSFSATYTRESEHLDQEFAISSAITLPVGERYTFNRLILRAQTANRRTLAFNGSYEVGQFYSGTRDTVTANLTIRARPGLIVYTTAEWNAIDLPEGSFETRLYRIVGETQFSPWIALVNNLQYDSVSRVLGWQSRFRWIMRPGSDLYVVYTHNWRDEPIRQRFETFDRRLASKVLYTHRF